LPISNAMPTATTDPGDFLERHWIEECKEIALLIDVVCDSKKQFHEMTTIMTSR
jgi:hypothetical protein